jgi:5,6-dimethylbenzimidazole synthase
MLGQYSAAFQTELLDLMAWRRDVRHFRTDPVEAAVLNRCLKAFSMAPSVGLSEPWRIIDVQSAGARAAVIANFTAANTAALQRYSDEKAGVYARLKLAGLQDAPVHLAVFCDTQTQKGAGLGAATMPEMRAYSVVGAINMLWLALRAQGLGLGWVSILDPDQLARDLAVPQGWLLIGYLCIGWPKDHDITPELQRAGWETRAVDLNMETR